MKKIKKLTLNKEVVSILGGNDMNLVKGGVYSDDPKGSCLGSCATCFISCGCNVDNGAINYPENTNDYPDNWAVNVNANVNQPTQQTQQNCGDSVNGNSCRYTQVGSCAAAGCPSAVQTTPCC